LRQLSPRFWLFLAAILGGWPWLLAQLAHVLDPAPADGLCKPSNRSFITRSWLALLAAGISFHAQERGFASPMALQTRA
jgi:hypothetical protein